MAIRVELAWNDRTGGSDTPQGSTRTLNFIIDGTSDYNQARQAVIDFAPPSDAGLVLSSIGELTRAGEQTWKVPITYTPYVGGLPDPSAIEFSGPDAEFRFETGGKRKQLNIALGRSHAYLPAGQDDPGVGNYINFTADGLAGVEIDDSVFNFTITKAFTPEQITGAYVRLLFIATPSVNTSTVTLNVAGMVLTFQAGELLFRGASGGVSLTDGVWRLTYSFSAQEGGEVDTIPNIDPFPVDGWSYLELRTVVKDAGDPVKLIVPEVLAAIVHQTYKSADHNDLGI
jgi:hypothetical protein